MRKLLLLICLVMSLNATEYMKNGQLKIIDDKEYIIRCIEGTKWIQFIEKGRGRGDLYFPSGNPQQIFERERSNYGGTSVPVVCDK